MKRSKKQQADVGKKRIMNCTIPANTKGKQLTLFQCQARRTKVFPEASSEEKECIVLDADDSDDPVRNDSSSISMDATYDAGYEEMIDDRTGLADQKSSTKLISSLPIGTKQTSLQAYFGCSRIETSVKNRGHDHSTAAAPTSSAASSSSNNIDAVEEPDCDGAFVPSSKKLPYYKRIADTSFVVDAFCYGIIPGVQIYFLSHFHSDHYYGLTGKFSKPIYCSKITASLVVQQLRVQSRFVHGLPLNEPVLLPDGSEVTLFDSNHCPGAVMFYFRLADGRTILHCGDMRAEPHIYAKNQQLQSNKIDLLYLDTTYMDPEYAFPSQAEMIQSVVDFVLNDLKRNPDTLVVVGAYSLGKERVFEAIAESLDCKIAVTNAKQQILRCLNSENLNRRMTKNWPETPLHVLPMMQITQKKLAEHLKRFPRYTRVIGIRPSGWEFSERRNGELPNVSARDSVTIVGIPYSEHSSFQELREFIQAVRPEKIIPTVYNRQMPMKRMQNFFNEWLK